ncbi:MAG: hypothetical protein A3D75_01515 [Candidatus Levybacteria bacterium RIFCSPHIGHO2_02_FULL_37_18]|nr:MAG: hypothetical protein A3D75_01515 [Candidatus Levybacteria bacterium RIFCSPHIGHO2_02_FULL_37_18]OGH33471.1 MAG: hypothetical protein A3A47_04460 [Candidatus Levybacteria bacterium RIFCSPLOWO2_01_FULL_37_20]OGH44030.1 MAG: hypothetical protein A3J14_04765 [Candidatus Levybacteria bacterium RIFCSPLOWO2_02_FULL_37_18]
MGYTKDAVKGISWIGTLRFSTRAIAFIRTIILARILIPSQFGAYGVAILIVSMLEVLTETGVNVVLVQEKDDIEEYISSAWIISIVRGCIIGGIILVSAHFISSFFHSKESYPLLILISLVPILKGFINPSVVRFQRDLTFHKEFWYRLVIFSVDAVVAIVVALITKSAISFVFGLLAGVITEIILSFVMIRPRPYFSYQLEFLKRIINRGKWVTVSGIFHYLFQNFDNIVVGRMLGTGQLGLYQMAYTISIIPITEITDVFSRVTFPVYAKIEHDRSRLKRAFLKTIVIISILTIPFGVVLFFFSHQLVYIILGNKWSPITVVLPMLAISAVIRAIFGFSATLFLAVNKQEYVSIITFASILGLAFSIVPLVYSYGIRGAGMSSLIGVGLSFPLILYFLVKVLKKH